MPPRRVALALPLLTLACSAPAAPQKADAAAAKAEAKPEQAKPDKPPRAPLKKLPPKITPPPELAAKELPAAPSLPSLALESAGEGKLAAPEGLGVVLPHVALQLGVGTPKIKRLTAAQRGHFAAQKVEPPAQPSATADAALGEPEGAHPGHELLVAMRFARDLVVVRAEVERPPMRRQLPAPSLDRGRRGR